MQELVDGDGGETPAEKERMIGRIEKCLCFFFISGEDWAMFEYISPEVQSGAKPISLLEKNEEKADLVTKTEHEVDIGIRWHIVLPNTQFFVRAYLKI